MSLAMPLLLFLYTCLVFVVANRGIRLLFKQEDDEVVKVKEEFQHIFAQKGELYVQEKRLEEKTAEVFTLYDMTKEITRNFSEDDALQIFQEKLRETVSFKECRLVDPLSTEIKDLKSKKDYFLFSLKGKKKLLGYLAIQGISQKDKEMVLILAHQFALTLRRIRLYQQIEKSAITDSLTGVHTRRYILDRFVEEIRRSKARKIMLSFLMMDVDYFKNFNDQHGHLTGDQILREITGIILENIREIDIVGRYGGEEFCLVLPDTDPRGAYYVADRIRYAVEQASIKAYDVKVKVTISIGISTFPHDGQKMTELIDKADWALYRAKKIGRNQVCAFGVYS